MAPRRVLELDGRYRQFRKICLDEVDVNLPIIEPIHSQATRS